MQRTDFSPGFPLLLSAILVVALVVSCAPAYAGDLRLTATPYFSLGAYYRDCNLTDRQLCNDDSIGSNFPGTIDAGLRIRPDRPTVLLLYADEVDLGYHHQSYVNRGVLIPGLLDFSGKEAQVDMWGARFTWLFNRLSFDVKL